jgi:hypothetical protein
MIGVFLAAWVVFPAALAALSLGAGLAVRRACGSEVVPGVLIVPLGLAALVVLCGLLCYFAPLAPLAAPACVVVGVGGLVLERRSLGRAPLARALRRNAWALAAALGSAAIIAAPVVLSGRPGFTGYAHIVDISYEFDLAAHFAHSGRSVPGAMTSAYQTVLHKYLGSGYPGGATWTLGALSNLTPIDLSWLYQPFLAFVAAMSALAVYSLLGRFFESPRWRALGAFIAAQPNILVAYALTGGIKELSTSCFLLLSAALVAQLTARLHPGRRLLAVPIAVAATVASLSLAALPWLGVLGAGVLVTALTFNRERLLSLMAGAQLTAMSFLLSLPTLSAALKLLPTVKGSGPVDLGNLAAPMPAIASAGVWITGDYRFPPYAHQGPSEAVAIVVLVLAAVGLVAAVRRGAWGVAWLGAAGAISLYYVAHRYGPWIQFKADCVSAPIALLLAFAGAGALMHSKPRWADPRAYLGVLPAAVIAGAVLAGNASAYHDATLAPYARLHDLERIGDRFAGQGPTLTPDFEEYAEYYLRDGNQTSMVNGPTLGLRPEVNRAAEPGGSFFYDLNEFSLGWVESFRTIVMRRNPLASRPPSNYRLVYLSRYYAVWQRDRPAGTVISHVPLADSPGEQSAALCARLSAAAHQAGASARFAYTRAPTGYVQVGASNMSLSGSLVAYGGVILANGPGRATREQPIPTSGRYDLYLSGSFGRPVNVLIDGRHVGTAAYQISYPGEWLLLGARQLSAGNHRIDITVGGLSLHPGNGPGIDKFNRTLGPLVIAPAAPAVPTVRTASAHDFARVCHSGEPLRWVEIVSGP